MAAMNKFSVLTLPGTFSRATAFAPRPFRSEVTAFKKAVAPLFVGSTQRDLDQVDRTAGDFAVTLAIRSDIPEHELRVSAATIASLHEGSIDVREGRVLRLDPESLSALPLQTK